MPERIVGLDLGSHAVRAAEVAIGSPPEVRAFGQVGLPRGAVEHGEVVDPGAVAASLRRLFRESHIRGRRVRVGMANLRTIVRQVEMPAMPEGELRSALEFQAGEFIPLPIDETELDFQILESFESDDGEEMVRVLIAAAHRDTLENALIAVREAGLQAVGVDLVPFALVRSLGTLPVVGEAGEGESPDTLEHGLTQAVVSVGSGVTVVVVHELGIPRFVRIVASGGDDLSEAVAAGLALPFEEAEVLKRQLDADVTGRSDALAALDGPLDGLVNDIRGSVDFYATQPGARPLDEVVVTGGGTLVSGFVDRLDDALDVPVRRADLLNRLAIGDIGFAPEELAALEPYLPVPVGLALGGAKSVPYRINLLPGKERRVLVAGRMAVAGAAGLVALGAVLGALWLGRAGEIDDLEGQLDDQLATNQRLQSQIAQLEGARDLEGRVDQARGLVANALERDVSWSRMLQEIGRVIPNDVWLESFNGALAAGDEAAGREVVSGTATFTANGSDFPATAAWLQRLATVPSFNTPWVSQATRGAVSELSATVDVVTFSASANITEAARSERSREARERAGVRDRSTTATPAEGGGGQ